MFSSYLIKDWIFFVPFFVLFVTFLLVFFITLMYLFQSSTLNILKPLTYFSIYFLSPVVYSFALFFKNNVYVYFYNLDFYYNTNTLFIIMFLLVLLMIVMFMSAHYFFLDKILILESCLIFLFTAFAFILVIIS